MNCVAGETDCDRLFLKKFRAKFFFFQAKKSRRLQTVTTVKMNYDGHIRFNGRWYEAHGHGILYRGEGEFEKYRGASAVACRTERACSPTAPE